MFEEEVNIQPIGHGTIQHYEVNLSAMDRRVDAKFEEYPCEACCSTWLDFLEQMCL